MEWGRDDCLLWIADIYRPVFAVDLAEAYRGKYSDEEGARALLGPLGVAGACWEAARRMGWRRIDPDQAQVGALGVIEAATGAAGVIFNGQGWVGRIDCGYSVWPSGLVRLAWGVPSQGAA